MSTAQERMVLGSGVAAQSPTEASLEQTWSEESIAGNAAENHSDEMSQQLAGLQAQIDELKQASKLSQEPVYIHAEESPAISCSPSASSKYPTARLTGFFQADTAWFHQSERNIAAVGDAEDGSDFRRARLAAVGNVWDNVGYSLEMDFGFPGRPSFMDVWVDMEDVIGDGNLRIGQFRQPIGMEGLTSVKELTFMERSLPFALIPFRQVGAVLYGTSSEDLMTWAVSGFRFPTDVYGGSVGENGGYGTAARVTGLLVDREPGNVRFHIGGAYSFIDPSNDLFQYRSQPEVFVSETGGGVPAATAVNTPFFVDTGLIDAEHTNLFGAELAASTGSFYAQSEYLVSVVDQIGGPTVALPGAYAYAGYFLTGEQRSYDKKNGVFGDVVPNGSVGKDGGIGAWELAVRYSYLDFNDANVQGGRLSDITAGVNWHWNPHTKFQFNYIHAMLDSPVNGDSDANIFAMRAHLDF
ncbi:OprO/OprP family phosphate-selective porin [Rhodopirellula sp. P2]|uniref:OprO/OprP family phosphate-selective porin n=1 Tax=Rhodopirellula sp. P2 TaxID=2127060 RepID=UPI002368493F|nr:porin [Rhodopirellula sp. P2]WDQ15266.1 porin [Rhodopirellula sp. P2]